MGVDHGDQAQELGKVARRITRLETASPLRNSPDSQHLGSGDYSVQIGDGANSSGYESVAVGSDANASGDASIAVGSSANATHTSATAIGEGTDATNASATAAGAGARAAGDSSTSVGAFSAADAERSGAFGWNAWGKHFGSYAIGDDAETTATNQIMLGRADDTVVVPGTFSNPSARRLKKNITPAPALSTTPPELVEYEYIDGDGSRQLGHIADDLIGTDWERFVTFDDDGRPLGINYLGLMVAQVAQLAGRVAELESRQRICPGCVSDGDTVPLA